MKRVLAAVALAVSIGLALACGGGSSSTDEPQTIPTTGKPVTDGGASTSDDVVSVAIDPTNDGSSDDASASDGACDLSKPFGGITALTALNSASDDAAGHLTGDELAIYFASQRDGGVGATDIYVATRATRTASFGKPAVLLGVSTTGNDYDPAISEDGLSLIVSQYNGVPTAFDLFLYTRASANGAFGARQAIPAIESPEDDTEAAFARHDQTLCFARSSSLIYCSDKSVGAFGTPTAQGALTMGGIGSPYPTESADGLTMYFGSKRSTGAGGVDIWVTTRPTLNDTFGAPVNVKELNSPLDEQPTWLSEDSCRLYFQSTRAGGKGGIDLYFAQRAK
jgi:hypothetical protein